MEVIYAIDTMRNYTSCSAEKYVVKFLNYNCVSLTAIPKTVTRDFYGICESDKAP